MNIQQLTAHLQEAYDQFKASTRKFRQTRVMRLKLHSQSFYHQTRDHLKTMNRSGSDTIASLLRGDDKDDSSDDDDDNRSDL